MGIGTVDALLNGRLLPVDWFKPAFTGQAVGGYHSPLYVAGLPGAGSAPSAGVNGVAVTSGRTGTIPFPGAVANKTVYLNSVSFAAESGVGSAYLIDRLWENSGLSVTSTSSQGITPAALPARDINGTVNGVGVGAAIEVVTSLGAASATATLTYTDSDGNTGNTSQVTVPTSAVAGTWLPFGHALGDYGVRAITAFQLSGSLLSGSLALVLYRRVSRNLACLAANVSDSFGPADGGGPLYDGTAMQFIYLLTATSVTKTTGSVQYVQG